MSTTPDQHEDDDSLSCSIPNYWTALSNALDLLYAYDVGATDSGYNDPSLRIWAKTTLTQMDPHQRYILLSRHVRDYLLSEEAIRNGYGLRDAAEMIDWLTDEMQVVYS